MDMLVHVTLAGDDNNAETACGTPLLSALGFCQFATCVSCASGVVMCGCGAPGALAFCGFDDDICNRKSPCRCCDKCAQTCFADA